MKYILFSKTNIYLQEFQVIPEKKAQGNNINNINDEKQAKLGRKIFDG